MLEFYEAGALIACGELKPEDIGAFRRAMKQFADGRYTLRVEKTKRSRSHAQNRFWWGTVVPLFADHCGHYKDEMHEILKLELLPETVEWANPKTGEVTTRTIGRSTANLTAREFNELIERAQQLGAEMGIYIPSPNEVAA